VARGIKIASKYCSAEIIGDLLYSGVAKVGGRGTRAGAQALNAHQHTFCSHLKTRF